MTDAEIGTVNQTYLLLYGMAVAISLTTITTRWFRYRRAKIAVPIILYRDFILLIGLTVPIGAIILARTLEILPDLYRDPVWTISTGGLAVFSIWVFAIFELFVIERR